MKKSSKLKDTPATSRVLKRRRGSESEGNTSVKLKQQRLDSYPGPTSQDQKRRRDSESEGETSGRLKQQRLDSSTNGIIKRTGKNTPKSRPPLNVFNFTPILNKETTPFRNTSNRRKTLNLSPEDADLTEDEELIRKRININKLVPNLDIIVNIIIKCFIYNCYL